LSVAGFVRTVVWAVGACGQLSGLSGGLFLKRGVTVVYKGGQMAGRPSALIGTGNEAAPSSCASAEPSAPSAELSTSPPRP
jgi:hypothetical protein